VRISMGTTMANLPTDSAPAVGVTIITPSRRAPEK
jgi:hypothetical protein